MLQTLDHIGIAVENLEAGLGIWRDILGLKLRAVESLPENGVRVAFLEQASGPTIELVAPLGESSPIRNFLRKRGEGIHHLCFLVDDILRAMTDLKAQGLRCIDADPKRGGEGALTAFLHPKDVKGVLIELKQI